MSSHYSPGKSYSQLPTVMRSTLVFVTRFLAARYSDRRSLYSVCDCKRTLLASVFTSALCMRLWSGNSNSHERILSPARASILPVIIPQASPSNLSLVLSGMLPCHRSEIMFVMRLKHACRSDISNMARSCTPRKYRYIGLMEYLVLTWPSDP